MVIRCKNITTWWLDVRVYVCDYLGNHGIGLEHCIHVHGNIASSQVWVHGMVIHHSW